MRELYPAYNWEPYFADRLRALVAETGGRLVLFDGVVPYAGLLAARRRLEGTPFVWMRRGMWRPGVGEPWLAHASAFDLVVEPGDFAAAGDRGPTARRTDATRVAPISIASAIRRHARGRRGRRSGSTPTGRRCCSRPAPVPSRTWRHPCAWPSTCCGGRLPTGRWR